MAISEWALSPIWRTSDGRTPSWPQIAENSAPLPPLVQPSVAAEQLLSLLAEAADDDEFDDHDAVFDAWAEAADLADLELLEAE